MRLTRLLPNFLVVIIELVVSGWKTAELTIAGKSRDIMSIVLNLCCALAPEYRWTLVDELAW
jgi:hypothetical protein